MIEVMAVQREIVAKSILSKSGISDYALNCYVGCLHNCVYCYARSAFGVGGLEGIPPTYSQP